MGRGGPRVSPAERSGLLSVPSREHRDLGRTRPDAAKLSRPSQPTRDVRRVRRERVVSRRAYDTRARPDSYGPTDAFENSAQMSPRLVVSPRAFSGLPGLRALRRRPPGREATRGRHVETRGHTGRLSPSCLGCGCILPGSGAPSLSGPTALGHKRTVSPAVSPSQEARGPSLNRPAGPSCPPGGRRPR